MTAMLCQLHAADPEQPLPASRGDIYEQFVALLYERQHTGPTGNVRIGVEGIERYGRPAIDQAERALDHLHDLLAHLVHERAVTAWHRPSTIELGSRDRGVPA